MGTNKKKPSADEKLRRKMQKLAATGRVVRDDDGALLRFVRVPGGYKVETLEEPDGTPQDKPQDIPEPELDMTHLRLDGEEG